MMLSTSRRPQCNATRPGTLKRRRSRPWLLLLGVGILFTLTVLISIVTSPWQETLRRLVVLHMRHSLERNVDIEKVTIDPRGRVSLVGLTIDERNAPSRPWLSIRRIDVRFSPARLILLPFRPVGCIYRVDLDTPVARVTRDRRGTWSFADLLARPVKKTHDTFRGELIVRHGSVIYHDAQGIPGIAAGPVDETLADLSINMTRASDAYLPFRIAGTTATGHTRRFLVRGGMHLAKNRLLCEVRVGRIDLNHARQFLPKRLPVTLVDGTADGRLQVLAQLPQNSSQAPQVTLIGIADLTDVRALLKLPKGDPIPCQFRSGQIQLANDMVELIDVQGVVGNMPMQIDGTISHFGAPVITLQARTKGADARYLTAFFPALATSPVRLTGPLSGWLQMTGTTVAPQLVAHVSGPTIFGEFGTFRQTSADIHVSKNLVVFTNLTASAFGGKVLGKLWLSTLPSATEMLLFEGEATGNALEQVIAQYVPAQKPGKIPGLHDLRGRIAGPVTVKVSREGAVELNARCLGDVRLPSVAVGTLDAALTVRADHMRQVQVTLERCTVQTSMGGMRVTGYIRPASLQLKLQASQLDLRAAARFAQHRDISGTGFLTGEINGTPDAPEFVGVVRAQNGQVAQIRYDEAAARVRSTFTPVPRITLDDVHLVTGHCHVEGKGILVGSTSPRVPWRVSGTISLPRKTPVASVAQMLGQAWPVDGFMQGRVDIRDALGHADGEGTLTLIQPTLHFDKTSLDITAVRMPIAISGQQLRITGATCEFQGTPIHVDGTLNLDPHASSPQLTASVHARNMDIDTLTALDDASNNSLLTDDARVRIPLDVQGCLMVDANIQARIMDAHGQISPATFLQSLVVQLRVDAGSSLHVASIPYHAAVAHLSYIGEQQTLKFEELQLVRMGARGDEYRIGLTGTGSYAMCEDDLNIGVEMRSTNLNLLRSDLMAMHHVLTGPVRTNLAGLDKTLRDIPTPFRSAGRIRVNVSGVARMPLLEATVDLSGLVIAGNPVPDISGKLAYDTAPQVRMLNIEQITAQGGPDPNALAELAGTVTMPVMDPAGHEIETGEFNLSFTAQYVDLALLKYWIKHPIVQNISGEAGIEASITDRMTNPHVIASLDVTDPKVDGVSFDSLAAVVTLEDSQLILGRKVKTSRGVQRIPITLQFAGSNKARMEPMEIYGEVPITWSGTLQGTVKPDSPIYLNARLPKQGLEVVREYFPPDLLEKYRPNLSEDSGMIEGALEVAGTCNQPRILTGSLRMGSPEMTIAADDVDVPNVLRDVAVDIGVHSVVEDGNIINIVEFRDLSAIYDRTGESRLKRDGKVAAWLKSLLGIRRTDEPFRPGSVVARGTVRIDPRRVFDGEKLRPWHELPNYLEYDLYAKTVKTPTRWRDMFHGVVTGYLHLGNATDAVGAPLLTGVMYLEEGTIRYTGKPSETYVPLALPINPRLSIALQSGEGNTFEITPSNPLLSAIFPFAPTMLGKKLFSPSAISDVDQVMTRDASGVKLPVDQGNLAYWYSADTLLTTQDDLAQAISGTRGAITGTLAAPEFEVFYLLNPRKAKIQLPGGTLTVDRGEGVFRMSSGGTPHLIAKAEASGRVDEYQISAIIDGDLLEPLEERPLTSVIDVGGTTGMSMNGRLLPITFATVSAPSGAQPLSDEEIARRLIGLETLTALLSNNGANQGVTPLLYRAGSNLLLKGWLDEIATKIGLDSVTLGFDPLLNPEATIITPELARSKWSAIRLGATTTMADQYHWRMWMDYRVPEVRWLRNFTISTTLDDERNMGINFQYKHEF